MKLLFDATELSYFEEKSGHRGGVFVVALNLLREFKKLGLETIQELFGEGTDNEKVLIDVKGVYKVKELKALGARWWRL